MAGAGLAIYDPSTADGGRVTFKGVLDHIDKRLHEARVFRQRLVRVPFDLDHPYWIEDPDFDLEFHVRHIALPAPGDWRQLCIQVARLISRPLDLNRPLWELYVIEGLDNVQGVPAGCFAVVTKTHHAAIDGMSGMELTSAIHDDAPRATPSVPGAPWRPESVPATTELLRRATVNNTTRPMHATRVMARTVPRLGRLLNQLRQRTITPPPTTIPRTRWSGTVSAHRVFDGIRLQLDDLRAIKSTVPGATINDVVLATVGGALRGYLLAKDELPSDPLIAMAPISVRSQEERGAAGNLVSGMFTTLGTDVADPSERLAVIREATHRSKEFANALGARDAARHGGSLARRARRSRCADIGPALTGQPSAPHLQHHRDQHARTAAQVVHGRCGTGVDVRHRHDRRGHGPDPPGVELLRRHHHLVHVVPRDAARPCVLCRLPAELVRRAVRRGRRQAGLRPAGRDPATEDRRTTPSGFDKDGCTP